MTDAETPTLWRDMTSEQKGALLLAQHEGATVQILMSDGTWRYTEQPGANIGSAYRVKPEDTIEGGIQKITLPKVRPKEHG